MKFTRSYSRVAVRLSSEKYTETEIQAGKTHTKKKKGKDIEPEGDDFIDPLLPDLFPTMLQGTITTLT